MTRSSQHFSNACDVGRVIYIPNTAMQTQYVAGLFVKRTGGRGTFVQSVLDGLAEVIVGTFLSCKVKVAQSANRRNEL